MTDADALLPGEVGSDRVIHTGCWTPVYFVTIVGANRVIVFETEIFPSKRSHRFAKVPGKVLHSLQPCR